MEVAGMSEPDPKSAQFVSAAEPAYGGSRIELRWTYIFDGGRAGSYRASSGLLIVRPSKTDGVVAVTANILERFPRSGAGHLFQNYWFNRREEENFYYSTFEWQSTVDNDTQELTVILHTTDRYEPVIYLRDPLSRRSD